MNSNRFGQSVAAICTFALTGAAWAGPVFLTTSETSTANFSSGLPAVQMGLTYDGSSYWTASGGGSGGDRLAQISSSDGSATTYKPGIDFRSLLTYKGVVYGRAASSNLLQPMTAPGVFSSDAGAITLTNGPKPDAKVAFDGTYFIAREGTTVRRWTTTGADAGSKSLDVNTFSNDGGTFTPGAMAAGNGLWFTYFLPYRQLTAWDPATGAQVDSVTLTNGPAADLDSLSLSIANNSVWLSENAAGGNTTYYAYAIPEPTTMAALGFAAFALTRRRPNRIR